MQQYNCYSILSSVRRSLYEHSLAYVQGTDTTGRYDNDYLLEKINEAYREIFAFLAVRLEHYFMEEIEITGADSVFELPADYGTLIEFRDADGNQVFPINWGERKNKTTTGATQEYYRNGNTLVLNKAGISSTYTLYYKKKCRNIEMGQAAAGSGALALVMAASSKNTNNYYNGMYVENITQDLVEEIVDYTGATQTAIVTSTPAAADWYGLVPEVPEPFMHMIQRRAVAIVREDFPLTQGSNTGETYKNYTDQMAELLQNYGDLDADVPVEEDFEDFSDFEDN